jgi:hypothetical protein
MNFNKRDVKFFIFGCLTVIVLNTVLDWQEHLKSFSDGFSSGYNSTKINSETE